MKRPLALFCCSIIAGAAAAFCLSADKWLIALALAILGAVFPLILPNKNHGKTLALVLLGMALAFSVSSLRDRQSDRLFSRLRATEQSISFTVLSVEPSYYGNWKITATATALDTGDSFTAEFYADEMIMSGTKGRARALISQYDRESRTVRLRNITFSSFSTQSLVSDLRRLRVTLSQNLSLSVRGDEGALAAGIAFGDKSQLSEELRFAIQDSGAAHMLVVSGMHVSILINALASLLKRFRTPYIISFLLILLCSFCLLVMMDFSVSVIRCTVMISMVHCAGLLRRKADSLTSLSFAAVIILLADWGAVSDGGFWLSFCCCFALVVLLPATLKKLPKTFLGLPRPLLFIVKTIISAFVVSLSISPVLVMLGMSLSPVSPITNTALLCLMLPVLLFSVLSAVICSFSPVFVLSSLILPITRFFLKLVLSVTVGLGSLPFSSVSSGSTPIRILVFSLFLFFILLISPKTKTVKKLGYSLCGLGTAISVVFLFVYSAAPKLCLYASEASVFALLKHQNQCCAIVSQPDSYVVDRLIRATKSEAMYPTALLVTHGSESDGLSCAHRLGLDYLPPDMAAKLAQSGQQGFKVFENDSLYAYLGSGGYSRILWTADNMQAVFAVDSSPLPHTPAKYDIMVSFSEDPPSNAKDTYKKIIMPLSADGLGGGTHTYYYVFGEWIQ